MPLRQRTDDKTKALRKVPIFSGLSDRHLRALAGALDEVKAEEGLKLTTQGSLARDFLLIVRGGARVQRNGRTIARLGPGDFFGEMSLIDGKPRSATVIADRPSTLLVMHARSFSALIEDIPGLARKIMVGLSERLREADEELASRN